MRLVGRDKLVKFKSKHANVRPALDAWEDEARRAHWQNWADIKADFPRADWIGNGRVVFDIKGNHYRLLVLVRFTLGIVQIERVGTHAEYEKWRL